MAGGGGGDDDTRSESGSSLAGLQNSFAGSGNRSIGQRPASMDDMEADVEETTTRGYMVLAAYCLHTACNACMFMNYAAVPEVAKAALHGIDDSELNMLYSAALLAVLPCTFPVAYYMVSQNYSVMLLGAVANAAGAWLRWASVHEGSYTLAVLGSVSIGIALSTILAAVAYIPECWFPKHRQMMATSVGVQANYAGWALGAVLHPYVVGDVDSGDAHSRNMSALDATGAPPGQRGEMDAAHGNLETLLVVQACVVTVSLVVFLLVYRAPEMTVSRALTLSSRQGFLRDMWNALDSMCSTAFIMSALCTSALGGVSWVIPAVQAELFTTFSSKDSAWTNVSYIGTGVVAGLVFGTFAVERVKYLILRLHFLAGGAVGLVCVVTINRSHLPFDTAYPALLILMAACGMAALGFIGPAIDSACAAAPSVPQSLSGGMIMWLLQVWGAILTPISVGDYGFVPCTVVAWGAAALYLMYIVGDRAAGSQQEAGARGRMVVTHDDLA